MAFGVAPQPALLTLLRELLEHTLGVASGPGPECRTNKGAECESSEFWSLTMTPA
jgi:hypothetical protein